MNKLKKIFRAGVDNCTGKRWPTTEKHFLKKVKRSPNTTNILHRKKRAQKVPIRDF